MRFFTNKQTTAKPRKVTALCAGLLTLILSVNLGFEALAQTKTPLRGTSASNQKPALKKKRAVVRKAVQPKSISPKPKEADLDPSLAAALTPVMISPATLTEPRGPFIEEAPMDDIARVAWCRGALEGHMELASHVASITPYDQSLLTIGTSYARAYESALSLSIEAQTQNGQTKIAEARNQGRAHWDLAFQAQLTAAAWAYDTWQLPGDCEHAAIRISGRDQLFQEMATDAEIKVINDTLTEKGPMPLGINLPKPAIKAETAPIDPEAPVSSNSLQKVKRTTIPPNT